MNVSIKYVKDAGSKLKERIVLKVLSDDDIGRYVLFDTTYLSDDTISNEVRHPYWFPDKGVAKGDLVVLYTRSGTNTETSNTNGTKSHFFYMGIDRSIWNKGGDCAVLLEVSQWVAEQLE